ncbi:precorrin-6A synthase (deacetylating) [Sporichthya sp.]|uniref:precorrin-6A synthase (deacetylating) n=1 Tax=Sporichthya sp. TaxID=65475 RepID=UPI0025F9DC6C|nr:precorrin-6A synthase (deacetylating) [Sporichthya sp.]
MRNVYVIGIGAGDPEQLTLQAVRVLADLDVVLVIDKGEAKRELTDLRHELCATHITKPYRVLTAADPDRDRTATDQVGYTGAVGDWYDARAEVIGALLRDEVSAGESVGILVWGDPALYDSTLRVLDRVEQRGTVEFGYQVIPGITSLQTLAARHKVTFTGVGAPVHVTTGRRLAAGMPAELDDVLVMLDGSETFAALDDPDLDIYWGAYLGMPGELLVAGNLQERKAEIVALRAQARARHGWIMDSYLLRRRRP